jgi:KUP system potassium uptake protein
MYIPSVNWMLCICCLFVIWLFQESAKMEAAYGLSISITMLMTSCLLTYYMYDKNVSLYLIVTFLSVYMAIEGFFLVANLFKFLHGGWFTVMMGGMIFGVMFVWYMGREIKKRFTYFVSLKKYTEILSDLKNDPSIPKFATHLIYLTRADKRMEIEYKIIYSILNKNPKRADIYWFIHVHILDDPYTMEYSVETIVPNILFRVEFRIGFRINPRINLFFRRVIEQMLEKKEIDILSRYESLRKHKIPGDFKFVMIDRVPNVDIDFSFFERIVMNVYTIIQKISITEVKAFGLDTSNVTVEEVPLSVITVSEKRLKRIEAPKEPEENNENLSVSMAQPD